MDTIPLVLALIPFAWFCYQSFRERKKARSLVSYLQFGDDVEQTGFWATLMASNCGMSGAIYLIAFYGYLFGPGAFFWVWGFWVLTQVTGYLSLRTAARRYGEDQFYSDRTTLHELLASLFKAPKVRLTAGILSTLAYTGLVSCELLLGHEVIESLLPGTSAFRPLASLEGGSIILLGMMLVVTIYIWAAGFRAVIRTDKLQLALNFLGMLALWILLGPHLDAVLGRFPEIFGGASPGESGSMLKYLFFPGDQTLSGFMISFVLMNLFFWGMWWPSAMDHWHRCAVAHSNRAAMHKFLGVPGIATSLYFGLLTITYLTFGAAVRVLVEGEAVSTHLLFEGLAALRPGGALGIDGSLIGWVLIGLVTAGPVAAVVSTVDSYLTVATQSFVSDYLLAKSTGKTLVEASQDPKTDALYLAYCRAFVVALSLVVLATMYLVIAGTGDVYTIIYLSFGLMFPGLGLLLVGLLRRKEVMPQHGALPALLLGGAWSFSSNLVIVWQVETHLREGSGALWTLGTWYNALYMNPLVTSIITALGYFVFRALTPVAGRQITGGSK